MKRTTRHKLEFLALRWSVSQKFKDYLYGHKFTVLTDNNPLSYVLSTAKLDATGHRWLAELGSFDFNISYRAGNLNGDADTLSRRPQHLEGSMIKQLCQAEDLNNPCREMGDAIERTHCEEAQLIDESKGGKLNWKDLQLKDNILKKVIELLKEDAKPSKS